ncbi:MAG TPA: XdhC/CoxI family protein [Coleofasciculaceae cyanobacterium]
MTACYLQLAQALQHGAAVLATVTQVQGSVPREVGAKMVICCNRTFNTIGGGAGEAKVMAQALQVLQTGKPQFVEIDLSGTPQRQTEGVCGGKMQVWLQRWSGERAIALVDQILQRLQTGQTAQLVLPFSTEQDPYLLAADAIAPGPEQAYVERLQLPPTLLIVGAGHVGEQLAKVADLIGFRVLVQDDRSEWANSDRYPQAARIYNQAIAAVLDQLTGCGQLYITLVTRGYQQDLEALKSILQHQVSYQYLGMIGSQKRVSTVYRELQQAGISPALFKTIHAPIGLNIGALTPAEIAVSISAELIQVRRREEIYSRSKSG